jgi:Domain of Unknown Function (DUF1259)
MIRTMKIILLCLAAFLSIPTRAVDADWMKAVAQALGKAGTAMPGDVYRVGLARSDLKVTLDGVQIKPALALGSWLAFANDTHGGTVMGDLVLLPAEVGPVMRKLEEGGIQITALHNHLLRNEPFTMYMHVMGHGDPSTLAATLRTALLESKTPLSGEAAATGAAEPSIELDTAAIDKALGHPGKVNGGVYQMNIARADRITDAGMEIPEAMGSAIAINFQPTGAGKCAITGDFVLTAKEVNPVIRALQDNGIEVTALHNHMLTDEPRLFFMHFWANDQTDKLLSGLKVALSRMNTAKT